MKRNLFYLLILLLMAGLTYYVFFRDQSNSFELSETNFNVKDTADLQTIFLIDMQGQRVKIARSNRFYNGWALNDTLPIRKDAVDFMLEALALQKAEQPVPSGYHDAAIRELSSNATKVELYTPKGKTHTFYVARNAGYGNVTYMLNEGAKRPYIVKLPMQNIFLGVRYYTRANDWRERRIMFNENPIETVNVAYKDSIQYSFTINFTQAQPSLQGPTTMSRPLNLKRVNTYRGVLDKLYCTGFEERYLGKDSIIQYGKQLGTVTIQRKNSPAESIILYFKLPDKGTKGLIEIGGVEYDYDSFFGLLNQHDFLVLSRKNVEKMLRTYPEFYEQDVEAKP